jgi:exopolysaccharide biosynthesis polyprenyl glycosylphosphotransferase
MSRLRFTLFSLVTDALFVNAAVVLAFLIRFFGRIPAYNFRAYLALAPLLTAAFLICGWLYGLYEPEQIDTPWSVTSQVLTAVTLGTLVLTALAFFGGTVTTAFSRWTIPLSWAFAALFLVSWRILFLRFGTVYWPEQRTLILGLNATAVDLARALNERRKWGWNLIDTVGASEISELNALITAQDINRVLIAEPAHLREFIESLVLADHPCLAVDVVPELYETFIGHTDAIIGDIPLMRIVSGFTPRYQRVIKRAVDLVGSLILLVLTSPITIIAATAALITQGRPLLYRQVRVGCNQRSFCVFKFRTMVNDAETRSGPVLATEDDPRITPVGRFLRKYRIDELPQILNIIRGDMSFIGPRPERPAFVETYLKTIPGYAERFRIKPGATGLAQINGGYATTPERKLKYDLMYLYHQSLGMDAQILVETVKVVLTGKGAR